MTKEEMALIKSQLLDLAAGCVGHVPVPVKQGEPQPPMRVECSGGSLTINSIQREVLDKLAKGKLKTCLCLGGEGQGAVYQVSCIELCTVLNTLPKKEDQP